MGVALDEADDFVRELVTAVLLGAVPDDDGDDDELRFNERERAFARRF